VIFKSHNFQSLLYFERQASTFRSIFLGIFALAVFPTNKQEIKLCTYDGETKTQCNRLTMTLTSLSYRRQTVDRFVSVTTNVLQTMVDAHCDQLKPRPHQRQCRQKRRNCRRNRQHCVFGNNVAGFGDNVVVLGDNVAVFGDIVAGVDGA